VTIGQNVLLTVMGLFYLCVALALFSQAMPMVPQASQETVAMGFSVGIVVPLVATAARLRKVDR